jgi:hypothetical protein
MATSPIIEHIVEQLRRLPPEDQQRVLDFARELSLPKGTPGKELLHMVGAITPADLDAMQAAIDDPLTGCERLPDNGS